MTQREQFVKIKSDGQMALVETTTRDIEITDDIVARLSQDLSLSIANFTKLDGHQVGIAMNGSEVIIAVHVSTLNLNTNYHVAADGLLHPKFCNKNSNESSVLPVLPAKWQVPANMKLVFAARVYGSKTKSPSTRPSSACFLLAFDEQRRAYRLPIGNLFDDGAMCMGEFQGAADSCMAAFVKAYEQLQCSDWNGDLLKDQEKTDALFSFKMTEASVECVPFVGDWTAHCEKIATPTTSCVAAMITT
jgi:hypothetical protein